MPSVSLRLFSRADSQVLCPHGARLHGSDAPPGLWGAAVISPQVGSNREHQPGGGQRTEAPSSQPPSLCAAPAA